MNAKNKPSVCIQKETDGLFLLSAGWDGSVVENGRKRKK